MPTITDELTLLTYAHRRDVLFKVRMSNVRYPPDRQPQGCCYECLRKTAPITFMQDSMENGELFVVPRHAHACYACRR